MCDDPTTPAPATEGAPSDLAAQAPAAEAKSTLPLGYASPDTASARSGSDLARTIPVITWGLFITNLGQMVCLGWLPVSLLLKNQLGVGPLGLAAFRSLAVLPWNFKIIMGLLSDTVPMGGTRRKHYLMLGSSLAASLWLLLGAVPRTYAWLVSIAIILNVAMVMASTVIGGLLVECGQKHGATGRLSSLRLFITYGAVMLGSAAGGQLASVAFGWTAAASAALWASLAGVALLLVEPKVVRTEEHLWRKIRGQLKLALGARTLWIAAGLIFLVQIAPGFSNAPLLFYQTDRLKFDAGFIGFLGTVNSFASMVGAALYALACRKISLRWLMAITIVALVLSTCTYIMYIDWRWALAVEACYGLGYGLAQMPLYDLAARATPRNAEAMTYALMMSAWNIGLTVSDLLGSWLYESFQMDFRHLIWINAGTTALVLLAVPLLPRQLVGTAEGQLIEAPAARQEDDGCVTHKAALI